MIKPQPLTQAAFAPYGDVIECGIGTSFDINAGFATRHDALSTVSCDGDVAVSIFEGRPRPLELVLLERHPLGTQAFMPLDGQDWLVIVADAPTPQACKVFLCTGAQGVQYNRNVWHHPLMVLGAGQKFLVVDRANPEGNLVEVPFKVPVPISV
ncbi:MAG: ureidoglycolate lyase [Rhodobacteraceae bacterium]|nr:MAG: ureidoglycolate lyase [Paracoccaceae bacterium]